MSTIDRYLARTFVGSYALLLLVGIGLYVFSDVLVNLDEFTKDRTLSAGAVLLKMLDYYGYNVPLYYQQDEHGVPHGWVAYVKHAIRTLGWRFNTDRMLKDYVVECYLRSAGVHSCAMPRY